MPKSRYWNVLKLSHWNHRVIYRWFTIAFQGNYKDKQLWFKTSTAPSNARQLSERSAEQKLRLQSVFKLDNNGTRKFMKVSALAHCHTIWIKITTWWHKNLDVFLNKENKSAYKSKTHPWGLFPNKQLLEDACRKEVSLYLILYSWCFRLRVN